MKELEKEKEILYAFLTEKQKAEMDGILNTENKTLQWKSQQINDYAYGNLMQLFRDEPKFHTAYSRFVVKLASLI